MARQKVVQFKKMEEEKKIMELKKFHNEQKNKIDIEYKEELDLFNQDWDQRFAELNERYEHLQEGTNERFQKEIEEHINDFDQKYPKEPKPPIEMLNLQKMLEQAVKQKDYPKAHQVQLQIHDLQKVDFERYSRTKQEKLNKEIGKLKEKQETELQVFQNKTNQTFNEFKKNRALETEKIIQKYKNKIKELEKNQKNELSETKRPNKKIDYSRPGSKIGSKSLMMSNSAVKKQENTKGNFDDHNEDN